MISLGKDNVIMEVASELQASVFLRNGYKRIEPKADTAVAADPTGEAPAEKPKRRTRKTKIAE